MPRTPPPVSERYSFARRRCVSTTINYPTRESAPMNIDWHFPPPRPGLYGALDRFIGPGATRAELALQLGIPTLAAFAATAYALRTAHGWSWLQYMVCFFLAFDIAGGVITNATSSAKRWYHRAGQGFKQHFAMVLLHLVHLFVVSWLFLSMDFGWFTGAAVFLLVAATTILTVPQYLQRPISLICYAGALLMAMYLLRRPTGLEWFLPLFYLKLLVSHLPKEEPYRPESAAT